VGTGVQSKLFDTRCFGRAPGLAGSTVRLDCNRPGALPERKPSGRGANRNSVETSASWCSCTLSFALWIIGFPPSPPRPLIHSASVQTPTSTPSFRISHTHFPKVGLAIAAPLTFCAAAPDDHPIAPGQRVQVGCARVLRPRIASGPGASCTMLLWAATCAIAIRRSSSTA
jgi:hypothetical protein